MTAIKNNSGISEVSEIGIGLTKLSQTYPISEDAYFELTFGKISDKSNELMPVG